eukprot:TRINITY_DN33476_c0_g1_i1.p1 TRINITY_DN33476_c0_g1~~TRINITY_DN33476_c0_g1_i1.p1  ORF type:complete len:227 (-),score=52.50 TRINITY_DN33476_c0_g1_i1:10-633(-)
MSGALCDERQSHAEAYDRHKSAVKQLKEQISELEQSLNSEMARHSEALDTIREEHRSKIIMHVDARAEMGKRLADIQQSLKDSEELARSAEEKAKGSDEGASKALAEAEKKIAELEKQHQNASRTQVDALARADQLLENRFTDLREVRTALQRALELGETDDTAVYDQQAGEVVGWAKGWNAAAVHFAEGRLPGTAPLIPDEELSVE